MLPSRFSKTYSHALTVYTQAWITINPCSGEGVYGVPAVEGWMLRCKVLLLWSHLWVSAPKGLPLLIKAIKSTLVPAGVRGFEHRSPADVMGCSAQSTILSPAAPSPGRWAPACWLRASQALEGAPGTRGTASHSGCPRAGMLFVRTHKASLFNWQWFSWKRISDRLPLKCRGLRSEIKEPGLVTLLARRALGITSTAAAAQSTQPGAALLGQTAFIPPAPPGWGHDQLEVVTSILFAFLLPRPLNAPLVAQTAIKKKSLKRATEKFPGLGGNWCVNAGFSPAGTLHT